MDINRQPGQFILKLKISIRDIHQQPPGYGLQKFHKVETLRGKLRGPVFQRRQVKQCRDQAAHTLRFCYDDLVIILPFCLICFILQSFGIGPDYAQGRFHFVGKVVNQFLPLSQQAFFLLHILFQLPVYIFQFLKRLLKVPGHHVQTMGKLPKLITSCHLARM